jgi:adenylate cyclase, class 2
VGLSGKAARGTSSKSLRKTPGTEVEIKLRVADQKAGLRMLQKLKAQGGQRMHEMNTLYDAPSGALAREGKLVRIRVLRPAASRRAEKAARKADAAAPRQAAVLTYKGPAQEEGRASFHGHRYKIREEQELQVDDADTLARVFEGMGLRPWFRYEKYRTTYRLPGVAGLLVDLDETPIGDFLELEGDAAAIDRGAALLGYRPADYITKSYGQLFVEQRRAATRRAGSSDEPSPASGSADMVFV